MAAIFSTPSRLGHAVRIMAKGQNPGRCRNRGGGEEQDSGEVTDSGLLPRAWVSCLELSHVGCGSGGVGGSVWAKVGENASPCPNAPDSHSDSLLC